MRMSEYLSVLGVVAALATVSQTEAKPHLVYVLADDFGHFDVNFHGNPEAPTPNLGMLAHDGIILNRYYVRKMIRQIPNVTTAPTQR